MINKILVFSLALLLLSANVSAYNMALRKLASSEAQTVLPIPAQIAKKSPVNEFAHDLANALLSGSLNNTSDIEFILRSFDPIIPLLAGGIDRVKDKETIRTCMQALGFTGSESILPIIDAFRFQKDYQDTAKRAVLDVKNFSTLREGFFRLTGQEFSWDTVPVRRDGYLDGGRFNITVQLLPLFSYVAISKDDIEKIILIAEELHKGRPGLPTILEIGCGKGLLSYLLANTGRVKVMATDSYPLAIRFCRMFSHKNLSVECLSAKQASEKYKDSVTLVLNSWMSWNHNLTPAIRDVNAPGILYVYDRLGSITGHTLQMEVMDPDADFASEYSYETGENYRKLKKAAGWKSFCFQELGGLIRRGRFLEQQMRAAFELQLHKSVPRETEEAIVAAIKAVDRSSQPTLNGLQIEFYQAHFTQTSI